MQRLNFKLIFLLILPFLTMVACGDDEVVEPIVPTTEEIETANINVVKNFYNTLINDKNNAGLLEILADDFYDNDAIPGQVQSAQGKIDQISGFFNVFPNATVNTETDQRYMAMGNYVAVYSDLNWKIEGPGFFGIEPTGQDILLNAIDIWEVIDGKITQTWHTESFAQVAAFQLEEMFCPDGMVFNLNRLATTNFPASEMQVPTPNLDDLSDVESANLELVKKHYRNLLIDFDFAAARENISNDFVDNDALPGEMGPDLEIQFIQGFLASFADVRLDIANQWFIVQDNMILAHTLFETPYNGQQPFFGLPTSGVDVSIVASDIWRIEDGKIVEGWHVENLMDVVFQSGGIICP